MTKEVEMEVDVDDKPVFLHNVDQIESLVNKELKEGDTWYVVDNKWFQTYKQYLQSSEQVNNPGPIDNSDLFKSLEGKSLVLKDKLSENEDFVYIPEELWVSLVEQFGIIDNRHVIRRQVIDQGSARTYNVIELYPIELKLCLHGTKEDIITSQFSRVTTLKQLETEMRRLFHVDDKKESQLWASGTVLNPYDPMAAKKNDDQTLMDAGLSSGSIVTLELQNSDGSWPSSRPRFGAIATRSSKITPGLCGLMNLGNTCFMNSALQCMSNTAPLTEYFVCDKYWDELNPDNPLGMGGEIAKTYGDLIKAMWSGCHSCLAPREFKQAVGKFSPQFSGFNQQDCQELMAFLLDGLHEDLNRVKKKPYIEIKQEIDKRPDSIVAAESWANYKKRNDSIIVDTFHGLLKSTLVCPECELVSVTFDPYCYLSLPLPVKRERLIDVTFVPAKIINSGPNKLIRVIKIFKLTVPKGGITLDICNAVAKVINDSKEVNGHIVNPSKLIVTVVNNKRITRIYNHDESYCAQLDEVLVFEKLDDCIALPVYLRLVESEDSTSLYGKPFFVNIKESTYEALYSAVKNYVEGLLDLDGSKQGEDEVADREDEVDAKKLSKAETNHQATASTATTDEMDHPMESGKEGEDENELFTLKLVNSYGSLALGILEKDKPLKVEGLSYIAADFVKPILRDRFAEDEELTIRMNVLKNANTGGKSSHNLSECIEQFTTTERLGEHDPWYCPRCKKQQQATKKFDIWSLPKVSIIHLKRFSYSKYWRDKLDTFVNFPLYNLDLGHYLMNNPKKEKTYYNLVAVANHYGGLGGGHYTAYGKNKETGLWYHFDDSNVTQASEDSVVSKAAYVLFYLRQD